MLEKQGKLAYGVEIAYGVWGTETGEEICCRVLPKYDADAETKLVGVAAETEEICCAGE